MRAGHRGACYNPSTQKAELGGSQVWDQPRLHSETLFQKDQKKKKKKRKKGKIKMELARLREMNEGF
jgi:hypothetical protein